MRLSTNGKYKKVKIVTKRHHWDAMNYMADTMPRMNIRDGNRQTNGKPVYARKNTIMGDINSTG